MAVLPHRSPLLRSLRSLGWALALTSLSACSAWAQSEQTRDVLGVAHTAGKYSFTQENYLNEGADELLQLGTRVIKVWFGSDAATYYPFNSAWPTQGRSLTEVAQDPYYKELFDKPFTTYILVLTRSDGISFFWDGMTRDEKLAERQETFELARYLLTTYAGTGKTFVLQNWEGDHLLRRGLKEGEVPDATRLAGMAAWWNARQAGVEAARRLVPAEGVTVVHAIEVNHLREAMAGKVTATNDVVPKTHADLYSYSSWDVEFDRARLTQALDYLAAKAPDSKLYGSRNIYLGEFGAAKDHLGPGEVRRDLIRELTDTALGWGVRYAIYWQVFCNEPAREYSGRPTNDDMRGFWLIRPDGTRSATWNDFVALYATSLHRVSLRARSGRFVAAEEGGGGGVEAGERQPGPWAKFTVQDLNGGVLRNGDPVRLQSHDGFYLGESAEGAISATYREPGPETAFVLRWVGGEDRGAVRSNSAVALESPSGRFLAANDATGAVRAVSERIGPAETFRLGLNE
jgi:hypothetical protein